MRVDFDSAHAVAVTGYERRDEGFEALGSYMSAARMRETQPVVMTYRPDVSSGAGDGLGLPA